MSALRAPGAAAGLDDAAPPAPAYAELDDLFGKNDVETADVALPSGQLVTVRGLTRAELLINARGADGDGALIERRNLATCLVRPTLTADQAEHWHRTAAAGDLVDVVGTIRRLSGLDEGAQKSHVAGNGDHRS